ncbi:hypothetical protein PHMEG_00016658 [Phytophthora megakarya]|uniref:Uncharacterized protein n=1 Tax=Phytophthora megakarya TaxID=4795 RepID=A0A225VY98_9STRA|nr:hypothetical protein PHMEG_00016658 [Phytophthora megakarya]
MVFNVSNDSITRYRNQVKTGEFALPAHGNIGNKHSQSVDETALKAFFTRLAETHGDIVPEYRMLPSYFTWEMKLGWYVEWAKDARVHFKEHSLTSFRTILERSCPNIRIRSPRDNVCAARVIYRNTMGAEPSVNDMEAVVAHIQGAKAMRCKYRNDCENTTADEPVPTIDFAQNIALPHLSQTPSM